MKISGGRNFISEKIHARSLMEKASDKSGMIIIYGNFCFVSSERSKLLLGTCQTLRFEHVRSTVLRFLSLFLKARRMNEDSRTIWMRQVSVVQKLAALDGQKRL
jgi:hypothetical protein